MSDDNNGNWKLTGNSGTNPANNFLGTRDGQPLVIRTNAVERVRITQGGNVGIGTTTPTQQLQITANELLPTAVANTIGNLFFGGDTSAGTKGLRLFSLDGAGGGFIDVNASSTDKGIIFRADTSNGGTERMRITAGGNVGIGTSNPQVTLDVVGNFHATGTKNFVQAHPTDPTKEIVYATLEGGEAGTYTRGTWKLDNGKAVIKLPEDFGLVTSEDGLTVQLTPRGEWLQLYVVQVHTQELVVRETQGKSGQFDYFIQGVRKGYEHHEVIQERK